MKDVETFISFVEGYYGQYPRKLIKRFVHEYLQEAKEDDLIIIWGLLLKTYSGRWNYPPDVAIIEKIVDEYNKEQKEKVGARCIFEEKRILPYIQFESNLIESDEKPVTDNEAKDMFEEMKKKFRDEH